MNPIFQPTIVPEETAGSICFKFGMEVLFYILFQLIKAIFDVPLQSQFMG